MQFEIDPCLICGLKDQAVGRSGDTPDKVFWEVKCDRCGHFQITTDAYAYTQTQKLPKSERAKTISGWVRLQNRNRLVPQITLDLLKRILILPTPTISERVEYLLSEMTQIRKGLWIPIDFTEQRFGASAYFDNLDDLCQLASYLEKQGLVRSVTAEGCVVTIEGQIFAESLLTKPKISETCFVAMWFDKQMAQSYADGFSLGIMQAGYKPIRIDGVHHNNKIDDEIIAHIRSSAFIVADFTGQRGGVYFEAGFAMGLGLPVVWTCKADDVEKLHFDIRQYNCVVWKELDELAVKLKNRIEATIGRGPNAVLN